MKYGKRKIILIEVGVLIALFFIAVKVFGVMTNRGNNSTTADMAAPTFPQVSFSYAGYQLNMLPGYAREMKLTDLRDTITPVFNGKLELLLQSEEPVKNLEMVLYTLDGTEELTRKKVDAPQESVNVDLADPSLLEDERMLQIILHMEDEIDRYFYTRVVDSSDKNIVECLDFIKGFHESALEKTDNTGVSTSIEPDGSGDNTTFQHVTIHSDYEHVSWGELAPAVEGSEMWMIKEMNSTSSSVQLQFQVRCKGEENEKDLYKVKEFFRVRYQAQTKRTLLLDYDRTMEQVFNADQVVLNEKGILLGIADEDVPYLANKEGTVASFVQADELWNYNRDTDEMALVFSFAAAGKTDQRNQTAQHTIRLLSMDEKGNTAFTVFGYMNRGDHEGEVGAAVYYYDSEENTVEERAFLSTDQSYDHAVIELGNLIYYSPDRDVLYSLSGGTLYQITVGKNRIWELANDLKSGEYVVSGDGKYIAYQTGKEGNKASEVQVLNLSSGKKQTVTCAEGEEIRPLGFMESDFVYGVFRQSDAGEMISGESVMPMYKLEIQSSSGKLMKTYEQEGIYILSVTFDNNMITLNRVTKDGGAYSATAQDFITNNESSGRSKIYPETYTTDLKEKQVRLVCSEGIENTQARVLKPKQVLQENPKTFTLERGETKDQFYVYGYGELRGICDRAGEAVMMADTYNGVVVDSGQNYIWERGNRDLRYSIARETGKVENMRQMLNAGTSPMEASAQINGGAGLDLTGCTPEELMYIVNQDRPVIAMLSAEKSVIITGYSETTVTYVNTKSGGQNSVSLEKMDQMTEPTGHMYIG